MRSEEIRRKVNRTIVNGDRQSLSNLIQDDPVNHWEFGVGEYCKIYRSTQSTPSRHILKEGTRVLLFIGEIPCGDQQRCFFLFCNNLVFDREFRKRTFTVYRKGVCETSQVLLFMSNWTTISSPFCLKNTWYHSP